MWIIEEEGFETDFNRVLGVPFKTENLYNQPSSAMIDAHRLSALKEIHYLLALYKG